MEITHENLEIKKKEASEKLEKKRLEIQEDLNCLVYAFQIVDKEMNPVDLFFKAPDRNVGLTIISAYQGQNIAKANQLLMELCFLKDESDPRISQEQVPFEKKAEYDALYYGAVKVSSNIITLYGEMQALEIKKK